jgi:hypothetical protein
MPLRRLLRVAIFCGALGLVGGQATHAQTPSSVRFVNLLLANEARSIQATMKAFNTRNATILKLNNATSQRQINQLNKTLTRLNTQVVRMTAELTLFSKQAYTYATELSPPNSSLVSEALGSLLTVQALSVEAGLGVAPATPTQ